MDGFDAPRCLIPAAATGLHNGLASVLAGGAIAMSLQSLGALYGVIGLSFLVYALVPGVAFRLSAWAPDGDQTARG